MGVSCVTRSPHRFWERGLEGSCRQGASVWPQEEDLAVEGGEERDVGVKLFRRVLEGLVI